MRSFGLVVAAGCVALMVTPAYADIQSCVASEVRSGDWRDDGVRIQFQEVIPGVQPDVAFDRIYRAASNKYEVIASDRPTRTLSVRVQPKKGGGFLGQMLQTSDMTYRLTFNVDAVPDGAKVTLVLKFRQGLKVGTGGTESYCEDILVAAN